jgi:FdrA protein
MNLCKDIRKNTYYDSVALMIITKEIKKLSYVKEVIVGMGTELNKELAENLNLSSQAIRDITPNDFFIAAHASDEEENAQENIIKKVNELLNSKKEEAQDEDYKPNTFNAAIKHLKDANLTIISLPGKYAGEEARKALKKGLHVMLFSDNVTIQDEIELKKLGRDKGLLVMGPDCGTAIINGVPLCFANKVRKGDIGIVGASGTGTQEITVIIDNLGGGVSQAIGTGGRDLKSEVGGIMMIEGFKSLIDDPDTEVIVLVSKPPAHEVAEKILNMVGSTSKPVVVSFIGGNREEIEKYGGYACVSLEDAAHKAVALSKKKEMSDFIGFTKPLKEIEEIVEREAVKFHKEQKYIRALYTGGTLADEAMKLLNKEGYDLYSNIPLAPNLKLSNVHKSKEHTCIDLGDDDFTLGKPHPMIDPMGRIERLPKEAEDPEVAIVLMDFVLGYGSNIDPAGEMLPYIIEAKSSMKDKGKYLCVVGYICGTEDDPQNYKAQKEKLEQAGVILMPSNAQAVRLCAKLLHRINQLHIGS